MSRNKEANGKLWLIRVSSVALILVLSISFAQAEVLLAKASTKAMVFGGSTYLVDFNGSNAGGTQYSFSTTAPNTKVVIMFNGECAVEGNAKNWMNIDIVVNPAGAAGEFAVKPSNGDNAFCSGNDTPSDFLYGSGDGWVSASTIGVATLASPGVHTIKVRVKGQYTGGISRLDDVSLVVMR